MMKILRALLLEVQADEALLERAPFRGGTDQTAEI
jgi:hypothetical protein